MKTRIEKPTNKELTALGFSRSFASELVRGKKLPSISNAQKIESATGYPANAWKLSEPA